MKHKFSKILGVGLTLALLTSLLLTAAPAGAAESGTLLSVSALDVDPDHEDRITVEVPLGTTLGQISSISWDVYLIEGYLPHVDIILDVSDIPEAGRVEDALVIEYAYNTEAHADEPHAGVPITCYGAVPGVTSQTFNDDGVGPAVIGGTANAWLTSGAPGPLEGEATTPIDYIDTAGQFVYGTLSDWQVGHIVTDIGANTPVLRLEIEIDNYILVEGERVDHSSWVSNIELTIDGGTVDLTANIVEPPDIIAISVLPTSIDFGDLNPGSTSTDHTITITNTGNVDVDLSTTVSGTFFIANLYLDAPGLATAYTSVDLAPAGILEPVATVQVPAAQTAGPVTGSITFEVVASSQ